MLNIEMVCGIGGRCGFCEKLNRKRIKARNNWRYKLKQLVNINKVCFVPVQARLFPVKGNLAVAYVYAALEHVLHFAALQVVDV